MQVGVLKDIIRTEIPPEGQEKIWKTLKAERKGMETAAGKELDAKQMWDQNMGKEWEEQEQRLL